MHDFSRLFKVWIRMTLASTQIAFANRLGVFLFIGAKLLRFGFFLAIIMIVLGAARQIGGYSRDQVILVFLVFTLVDVGSQMLFREVYRFGPRVVSGDFDLDLLKPLPSLFRPLLGGMDPMDGVIFFIYTVGFGFFLWSTRADVSWTNGLLFFSMFFNAILIAAGFHIFVLCLGLLTTQIDQAILVYRDFWNMGRFPTRIYTGTLGLILQTVIPIAVMVMIPTQTLWGEISISQLLRSLLLGISFFTVSLVGWKRSLRSYTSASS